jgi:hypothetical protein
MDGNCLEWGKSKFWFWCRAAKAWNYRALKARIELLITDHYPITNHFFRSSSSLLHFEWFKMLWDPSSSFFSVWTSLTFKASNFLILAHLKQFKVLQEHHLQFYKSSFNPNSKRATYKEFFGWSGLGFVRFDGLFFVFLKPSTLQGHKIFNFNLLSTIFSVSDAPIGGVQVLFGHQKQQSPPLGSGVPWALKWLLMGCSTLYTMIFLPHWDCKS